MRSFLLIVGLLSLGITNARASLTNLVISYQAAGEHTATLSIAANETLSLMSGRVSKGTLKLQLGDGALNLDEADVRAILSPASTPLKLAGPATLTFKVVNTSPLETKTLEYLVFDVSKAEEAFVPSQSVVIPADATGPVQIVMESSVDLITWTLAQPGTYGSSTAKRFFRIRAVAQN